MNTLEVDKTKFIAGKLLVVRHGETQLNKENRLRGWLDVPLTQQGQQDALVMGDRLAARSITKIYASDFKRTHETAEIINEKLRVPLVLTPDLRPLNFGELNGTESDAALPKMTAAFENWEQHPDQAVEGGESFNTFQARNLRMIERIGNDLHNGEEVLVVTHLRNVLWLQGYMAHGGPLTGALIHFVNQKSGGQETGTMTEYTLLKKNADPVILQNNSEDGWPSMVDMKVIDAGVVFYEDLLNDKGEHVGGNVLVQKGALDRMAESLKGKPIVNWDHRTVKPKEFGKGGFQGIVTETYFNAEDGWYHARGYVWDEPTRKNIQNGYSISCAYQVSEWGDGGTYHKVPYEKEVLNGSYTHIAVVSVPRYEGARIELMNSGGNIMGLLSLFRKDKPDEKVEFDPTTTKVPVKGVGEVILSELMNSYEATHAPALNDDDLIDVKGKKVKLSELKNSHVQFLLNAELDKLDKEHQNGVHNNGKVKNCQRCNSAASHEATNLKECLVSDGSDVDPAAAKKAADEKKNADDAAAKKAEDEKKNADEAAKKEEEEKKNALSNAAKLDELRNKDHRLPMPTITSLADMAAEGERRYGSKPAALAAK